ncbi:MAG: hypothetical protein JWM93_3119 [Frankiales bacterium]|nr:hypothetical protein [Frankiales bacterium]
MAIARNVETIRRAAAFLARDLDAATGDAWSIQVDDELLVTAVRAGKAITGLIGPELDEDDWEWDDLDAEILPTTLWHDAAEAVWDVVDGGFFCWAAGVPACPRPGGGPLMLASGVWTCRAHAHGVAPVGELNGALRP